VIDDGRQWKHENRPHASLLDRRVNERMDTKGDRKNTHIIPIITPDWSKKTLDCESCQASCQSACKTSCTVSNQPCPER
ncbi:MAG TPA: six-cysteine ranthipeptide SCIFF, partial [Bacillota bacterium]|nr:six-cysteine ranthipeptide SCIFF [Bacillota bacterium]